MPRKNSKTAFVLSQPSDASAKDIITAGKTSGITLTAAYIYGIRARAKRASGKRRGRTPHALLLEKADIVVSPERRFIALVAEIGLARADAILAELRNLKL